MSQKYVHNCPLVNFLFIIRYQFWRILSLEVITLPYLFTSFSNKTWMVFNITLLEFFAHIYATGHSGLFHLAHCIYIYTYKVVASGLFVCYQTPPSKLRYPGYLDKYISFWTKQLPGDTSPPLKNFSSLI